MGYLPGDPDDGFVKLVVSKDRIILGVHIIGPHASVLIQPFIYLMNKGLHCQAEDLNQLESRLQAHDPGHTMLRPHLCFSLDSTATIDQSMVIHPALSEVAAWATGYLRPVEKPTEKP
jgi:dihydrolipoamide dehydrogenase